MDVFRLCVNSVGLGLIFWSFGFDSAVAQPGYPPQGYQPSSDYPATPYGSVATPATPQTPAKQTGSPPTYSYNTQSGPQSGPQSGQGVEAAYPRSAPVDSYPAATEQPPGPPSETEGIQASLSDSSTSDEIPSPELFERSRILGQVANQTIYVGDLIGDINQMIEKVIPTAPEATKNKQREMLIEGLLSKMIDQKLLLVDVIENLPDKSKLNEIMEKIKMQFDEAAMPQMMKQMGVSSVLELDNQLRTYGTSLRHTREAWAENQLVSFFVRERIEQPEVNRAEMYEYYTDHIEDYQVEARVRWEQLMVRFDRFDTKQEAYAEIAKLGNEVVYGAKLSAVAKRKSQGYRASEGGQHDWTTKGALVHTEVDDAIFSLPVGALSDIITTSKGFHIVRVIEREEDTTKSFQVVQTAIKEKLLQQKQEESIKKYVTKLKSTIPHWTVFDEEDKSVRTAENETQGGGFFQ